MKSSLVTHIKLVKSEAASTAQPMREAPGTELIPESVDYPVNVFGPSLSIRAIKTRFLLDLIQPAFMLCRAV